MSTKRRKSSAGGRKPAEAVYQYNGREIRISNNRRKQRLHIDDQEIVYRKTEQGTLIAPNTLPFCRFTTLFMLACTVIDLVINKKTDTIWNVQEDSHSPNTYQR